MNRIEVVVKQKEEYSKQSEHHEQKLVYQAQKCKSGCLCCCSVTQSGPTPWTAALQASLSITTSQSLLKFMSVESVMPSNHLTLCRPLSLCLQSFPAQVSSVLRWTKYWSFSFSISPSNEYSGLIFFRIDWFDLLALQGTLKSPFQHHSSKASVF